MRKNVQSSIGAGKTVKEGADLKERPAKKTKADVKPKPTAKSRTAAHQMNAENTKAKPKASAKAKDGKVQTAKKSKTAVKSAKPNCPEKDACENDDLHDQRKAVRTPQVMKLVEYSNEVNPVLLAGKSRVPVQLRGRQSLTRLMRREMGEVFFDVEDTVVVNITELAIEQEAPVILDRFNACSCDKCVEVFSSKIAERVPVRFARVNKNGMSIGNRELSDRIAPMRKAVITEMIKELIVSKKRCFHDDTK